MKKLLAAIALLVGIVWLTLTPSIASAHTPSVTSSCDSGLVVVLTQYEGTSSNNKVSITVNGTTTDHLFGGSYSTTIPFTQGGASTTWKVVIDANINTGNATQYDKSFGPTTTGPCGTPPTTTTTTTTTTVPPTTSTTTVPPTTTTEPPFTTEPTVPPTTDPCGPDRFIQSLDGPATVCTTLPPETTTTTTVVPVVPTTTPPTCWMGDSSAPAGVQPCAGTPDITPTVPPGGLPATGSSSPFLAVIAGIVLLFGIAMVYVARRGNINIR